MTIDQLEQMLLADEARISRLRARQLSVIAALDIAQVNLGDGVRNMVDWTCSRLDVGPELASSLVQTSRRLADQAGLASELFEGTVSFDRVVEESRLVAIGTDVALVSRSRGWDISGMRRAAARLKQMSRGDEQQIFDGRMFAMQPTLDQSRYRLWGNLPGVDGRLLEQALVQRADQFPTTDQPCARSQLYADALVSIASDSIDGTTSSGPGTTALVTIFVDGRVGAATGGETGACVDVGPRVGPLTLEQILCGGTVEILATRSEGTPLQVGAAAQTIPRKLRRHILHRDGGACTADGCSSRCRLQTHHITSKSEGGGHHPDNLTTLCWYHHRVVIHRQGFQIDATSPPQRRRFYRPSGPDPP